jgi:hypothetical protein
MRQLVLRRFYGGEGPKHESDNDNIFTDRPANRRPVARS